MRSFERKRRATVAALVVGTNSRMTEKRRLAMAAPAMKHRITTRRSVLMLSEVTPDWVCFDSTAIVRDS